MTNKIGIKLNESLSIYNLNNEFLGCNFLNIDECTTINMNR